MSTETDPLNKGLDVEKQISDHAVEAHKADMKASPEQEATSTLDQVRKEQRSVLFRSPGFIIGVLVLGFWILAAIWPDLLSVWGPKDTVRTNSGEALRRTSPDGTAWFGTDRLGRDVYARVIHGARPILIAAPLSTGIAVVLGTLVGLFTGYFRGLIDEIVSRILEAILAIPGILLAIVILFTFGPTTPVVIGVIAFLFIPPVARTVRAATLAESQLDYVTAARMRGEGSLFIISRELFPNIVGVVVVEATVRIAYAVFLIATLAFVGLGGGNQTDADWGVDVAGNYLQIINDVWWPTIFPALAIASLVIAFNLIADSFEKAFGS